MGIDDIARSLSASGAAIQALAAGVSPEQARWRPAPGKWSVLEVMNHLYDEEREDFRCRLDLLLHHPGRPWPPVDPEAWCKERRYNDRALDESVKQFEAERALSLRWLSGVRNIDWDRCYEHPTIGPLRAGDIALSWMVHDHLHLRQLGGLNVQFQLQRVPLYSAGYAGDW